MSDCPNILSSAGVSAFPAFARAVASSPERFTVSPKIAPSRAEYNLSSDSGFISFCSCSTIFLKTGSRFACKYSSSASFPMFPIEISAFCAAGFFTALKITFSTFLARLVLPPSFLIPPSIYCSPASATADGIAYAIADAGS